MNNELIARLSQLELEKSSIKRNLDRFYYDNKIRAKLFAELKEVQNNIKKTKFMIRLEREKRNDIKY